MTCPVCGCKVGDAALHQQFHDGLREVARLIEAPGMAPEHYEQAIREQWEREGRL